MLLGVDIGTTSAKGAAFDVAGHVLASADVAYTHEMPRRGWAEADAEEWWRAAREILGRLAVQVAAARVEGIGITGQAPTLLAVDERGAPLRPAILWLDVRSEVEAADLGVRLDAAAEARSGNRIHAYYLGPKLAWLRHHEPGVVAATATVLQSHSYPVLRLTGARVTDYSSAALCAPLYDGA